VSLTKKKPCIRLRGLNDFSHIASLSNLVLIFQLPLALANGKKDIKNLKSLSPGRGILGEVDEKRITRHFVPRDPLR
jgi:hypothetical protein